MLPVLKMEMYTFHIFAFYSRTLCFVPMKFVKLPVSMGVGGKEVKMGQV